MSKQLVTGDEQNKHLKDAIYNIKHQVVLMKKCLDQSPSKKLMDALKHCSNFLSELRTNYLTPKQYYELYILVFDALEMLSNYLLKNNYSNHLSDLYELVQYAGNIVPRLYLMITVGTVYMSTPNAPVKEIMKDMIEMCRGVQHPIRGLFLRYFLSQRIKNLLPLDNDQDLQDSISFLIDNFIEMNKLWVRLQHQGHSSEKLMRLNERKELKILVGSNLVRLSQIENIDRAYYKSRILPIVFEQIIQCRDNLAQNYLIDVVIQVFPDEFHLFTLDNFLETTLQLNPEVSIGNLLITMIDRFINYYQRESENNINFKVSSLMLEDPDKQQDKAQSEKLDTTKLQPDKAIVDNGINLFEKFWNYIKKLEEEKPDLSTEEISKILESLLKLCLIYYPENEVNINEIFEYAIFKAKRDANDSSDEPKSLSKNWLNLLLVPIKYFKSVKNLLNLKEYLSFYHVQSPSSQKKISLQVLEKVLSSNEIYSDESEIVFLFNLLLVVIQDEDTITTAKTLGYSGNGNGLTNKDKDSSNESLEFKLGQENFTKVLHLIYHTDPNENLKLLFMIKKKFLSTNIKNIKNTYPTLAFKILYNLRRLSMSKADNSLLIKSYFKNLSTLINEIYVNHSNKSELVMKLYLNAAQLADQLKQESIAYELFTQAFIVYEESISDSKIQFQLILLIANKLQTSRNFSKDNYENLITKTTLYGSKLLKKPDQCRSVYLCSHLWWWCEIIQLGEEEGKSEFYRDNKRVLECLQKALRVADSCMDNQVSCELFIEILNRCLYYFIHGNDLISIKYINGLIDLIKTNLSNMDDDKDGDSNPISHFKRTLSYIEDQKEIDERFQQIIC